MNIEGPGGAPPAPERRKKIVLVENAEAVKHAARDAAESRMTKGRQDIHGWNPSAIKKRIWDYGLVGRINLGRETKKAEGEIRERGSIHAAEGLGADAHERTRSALIDRFASEYEETVHTEAGEERHVNEESERVSSARIKALLRDFVNDRIDEENFIEERNRIIADAFGFTDAKQAQSAVYHADNILEIAREVKAAASHGEGVEALINDLDIVIGRAKSGVRTEAHFDMIDRIVEKIQTTKLGAWVNETWLATAVAGTFMALERFGRSRIAAYATFGGSALVGGAVTGLRENARLKAERSRYAREKAQGKNVTESPEKEEAEKYRYQTESASALLTQLREVQTVDLTQPQHFNAAMAALANIESRIQLSDRNKIDLISYSDIASVEKERLDLDIARAEAKVALRNTFRENPTLFPIPTNFDALLRLQTTDTRDTLTEGDHGLEEKNRLFNKMKAKQVAKATTIGLGIGLIIGAAAQEASAAVFHNQQGLVHGVGKGTYEKLPESRTLLNRFIYGSSYGGEMPKMILQDAPDGSKIKLPEGMHLYHEPGKPPHQFALIRADNTGVTRDIEFDDHGHLTKESVAALKEEGFTVPPEEIQKIGKKVPEVVSYTPGGYVATHLTEKDPKNGLTHVHRRWMDQNSPYKPIGNALRLHWGGVKGTGIDNQGNYVYNVFKMTPGGSFHGANALNAQKAIANGQLKMLLSLTCETQSYVVKVDIHPDGNAVIDPNSPIGKMFFTKDDKGHAIFKGQYAEVGFADGNRPDGSENNWMLATDKGTGQPTIPQETTLKDTTTEIPITSLTPPAQDYYTAPPPIIPMYAPIPIGRQKTKEGITPILPISYNYFGEFSAADKEKARERMSENLHNNPNAELDQYQEAEKYLKNQDKRFVRKINRLAREAGPMDPECRLAICIPVAGHQEGENIYQTLENYLNQTADKRSFEIDLYVNRPDKDKEGKTIVLDKTLDEIARFRADHPELHVRVMNEVLPRAEARIGNVRKILNDATLVRHHTRGASVPDLILVNNDADNKGVSPHYVENFITKFNAYPKVDAMLGQLDWDPKSYIRNPMLHIGTRMFQYIDIQMRHQRDRQKRYGAPGANYAFRSSIYAGVGGYNANERLGEDKDLGKRITLARESSIGRAPIIFADTPSRLYTSSRRAERALKDGLSPYEQWTEAYGEFINDEVRKIQVPASDRPIDFNNPAEVSQLTLNLQQVINQTANALRGEMGERKMLERALGWLGVQYVTELDGSLRITGMSKLIEGLKEYQTEGVKIMERKTAPAS